MEDKPVDQDSPFHRFNRLDGDQREQLLMLAKVLDESPRLNEWVTEAIRGNPQQRRLSSLGLLDRDGAALGHYEGGLRTIRLDSKLLEYHPTDIPKLNLLTDVLGHEITHALRGEDAFKYRQEFSSRVSTLAASQAIPRDYTPLIQEFVEWRRQEEAIAELGGINAVASRLQHIDQRPVAEKALAIAVEPTSSCVVRNDRDDVIGFKPGIQFDPKTQTVPVTVGNQDAVARCFFDIDRAAKDYTTGAVADAMSVVAQTENSLAQENLAYRTREAHVNLQALGVDFGKLSQERLYGYADTGPFAFTDTSHSQATVRQLLLKTGKGQESPEMRVEAASLLSMLDPVHASPDPRQPAHPDHALYAQIRGGMEKLNGRAGLPWDESSDRTTARLLCDARERGLTRVDHLLASEERGNLKAGANIFLIQGRLDDPAHNRSCTNVHEAARTPEAESFERLETIHQKLGPEAIVVNQASHMNSPVREPYIQTLRY